MCNDILYAKWQKKTLLGITFPHLLDVFLPNINLLICIVISTFNSLYKAHLLWEISSALSVSLNTYVWSLRWHHASADVLVCNLSLASSHFIFLYFHFIFSAVLCTHQGRCLPLYSFSIMYLRVFLKILSNLKITKW